MWRKASFSALLFAYDMVIAAERKGELMKGYVQRMGDEGKCRQLNAAWCI